MYRLLFTLLQKQNVLSVRFRFLFFLLLTFLPHEGSTQTLEGFPMIKNYSPLEYDSHRQNWDIDQAPDGTMYFANGKGVLSFDGEEWQLTTVSNRGHVRSLDIDDEGTVYVGANNDLGKIEMLPNGTKAFYSFLPFLDTLDHEFGRIRSTLSTPGGIYFQSYNRIFKVMAEEVQIWRSEDAFFRLFSIDNRIILADIERGLLRLIGDQFISMENGEMLKGKRVTSLLPFKEKLFGVAQDEGLFLFGSNGYIKFETDAGALFEQVGSNQALITSKNKIAVIHQIAKGLFMFNADGQLERTFDKYDGLRSNDVLSG